MEKTDGKQNGVHGTLRAYAMYILALLLFGTNGLLVARMSISASQIVLLRTLIGGIFLAVLVKCRGGFERENIRADIVWLMGGGICLGCNWIALFEAYRLLNVSLATLIYYIGPMLILLLSPVLFHEKLTGRRILSLCIVAVGLVMISGSIAAEGMNAAGLLTAFVSALFYAGVIAFNKKVVHTGGMQTAAVELYPAFAVVLVYVLLTAGLPQITQADLPYILIIGIVNTGLTYFLYFSGLQKLPAQSAALLSYIDPVSALIFSALFLHEVMTPLQIAGAVLLLGGAVFGELRKNSGS